MEKQASRPYCTLLLVNTINNDLPYSELGACYGTDYAHEELEEHLRR